MREFLCHREVKLLAKVLDRSRDHIRLGISFIPDQTNELSYFDLNILYNRIILFSFLIVFTDKGLAEGAPILFLDFTDVFFTIFAEIAATRCEFIVLCRHFG